MPDDKPSRLLALPREMRNAIYSQLNQVTLLTKTDGATRNSAWATFNKAPLAEVLCTCKQINREYSEVVYDQAHLSLRPDRWKGVIMALDFKDGVPVSIFRHVRSIDVFISYDFHVMDNFFQHFPGPMNDFIVAAGQARDLGQRPNEVARQRHWTPTKQTLHCLCTLLDELSETFPDNRVSLRVVINMTRFDLLLPWLEIGLLQLDDLHDLQNYPNTTYARKGKLSLSTQFTTPCYSQIVESSNASTGKLRTRSDGTSYRTTDSAETGGWLLLESGEEHKYELFEGTVAKFCMSFDGLP